MTTTSISASRKAPSYAKLAIILGTLSAFAPLSIDMYLPALPTIAGDFNTQISVAQQTLTVFFIGLALGQTFYGPIADRVGRRLPLLFGCTLYTLACIGCAFAPTIQSLILLRFAQALGGCVGIVISRSIVRDLFDQQESARMYSFLMLVMGLAPITAPLLGGQLLLFFGWRAIFVTLAGFGLICFLLVTFILPESLPVERRTRHGLGAALRSYGEILLNRNYMGFAVAGGLASSAMFAYISGSSFVFIELNGVPPELFGFLFGTNAIGLVAAAQFNRWLLGRYQGIQILNAALTFTAFSGLLLVVITATGFGGFPAMSSSFFAASPAQAWLAPTPPPRQWRPMPSAQAAQPRS